jgi:hypothetical protein
MTLVRVSTSTGNLIYNRAETVAFNNPVRWTTQPTLTVVSGQLLYTPGVVINNYTVSGIGYANGVALSPPIVPNVLRAVTEYDVEIVVRETAVNPTGVPTDRITTTAAVIVANPSPTAFPADLTPSLFEYSEIRDSTAGQATGARQWVFGTLPSTPGFTLHRLATTSPTSTTPTTLCESGQTYINAASYGNGTAIYGRLYWVRTADDVRQLALASTGTTAGAATDTDGRPYQRALTAVSGEPTRGQIAMTIVGFQGGVSPGTAPTFSTAPTIAGSATVGSTLTATPATDAGTPTPTITHRWYRDGTQNEAVTGVTYATTVTLTSQNLADPAVFTTRGIDWTDVRRFHITGLEFRDSRTHATYTNDGTPVAADSAIGMRLTRPRDGRVSDCFFDRHHIAMDIVGSTDCVYEYITIQRCGMDHVRWYSNGPFLRTTFRRFLMHSTHVHIPQADVSTRHPDGFQGAVNWSAGGGAQTPPDTILFEYNYVETLQENNPMHGFFSGNAACRDPDSSGQPGGGYSLAVAGYKNITYFNNFININASHGIGVEGVDGMLVDTCYLKRSTSATTGIRTPKVHFLPDSSGLDSKYADIEIRNTTAPVVPGPGQQYIPSGQLTTSNYTASSSAPSGFETLVKSGASKNVGSRVTLS